MQRYSIRGKFSDDISRFDNRNEQTEILIISFGKEESFITKLILLIITQITLEMYLY